MAILAVGIHECLLSFPCNTPINLGSNWVPRLEPHFRFYRRRNYSRDIISTETFRFLTRGARNQQASSGTLAFC